MAQATSPLRYPGGKSCLLDVVSRILRENKLERGHYAEPYAGGSGLALALLYGGHVSDIHVNDLDPSIWSFWHCVLNQTDQFIAKVQKTEVTIDNWYKQRDIYRAQDQRNPLKLGFATFFLNRTNRSGIIKGAGVIGGLAQEGNYKLDCRFNKDDLIQRIRRIKKYEDRIHLYSKDALDFLKYANKSLPEDTFFCIDPPYFNKGASLYTSFYSPSDHDAVANSVLQLDRSWVVTYDNVPEIQRLFKRRRQYEFDINYSVQTKRVGTELLIASKGLRIPSEIRSRQTNRPQYRAA